MDNLYQQFNLQPDANNASTSGGLSVSQTAEMWSTISSDPQLAQMNPFSASLNPNDVNMSLGNNGQSGASSSDSNGGGKAEGKTAKKSAVKPSAKASTGKASKKANAAAANRSGLSEAEKVARREKHNQVEIRRRKRINQRFNELGDICGCDSKQKRNILTSAIEKLKEYEDRIQQLKQNLETLALDGDSGPDAPEDTKTEEIGFAGDHSVVDHRSVFMKSGVPLHVSGFDGRILDCNEKFAQLFGLTREAILANGVTVFSLTSPESLAVTFGVVGHLMKGNPRAQVDNIMIGPGGRLIKVKVTAWLIRDNGRPKYFMSMMVPDPNFQPQAAPAAMGGAMGLNQLQGGPSGMQFPSLQSPAPQQPQGSAQQQLYQQAAALGMGVGLPNQMMANQGPAGPSARGYTPLSGDPSGLLPDMRQAQGQPQLGQPSTPNPQMNPQLQQLQQQLNLQQLQMALQQQQAQQAQQQQAQQPKQGAAPPARK